VPVLLQQHTGWLQTFQILTLVPILQGMELLLRAMSWLITPDLKTFRRRRQVFSQAAASPPCEQGEAGGSPGLGKLNPLCALCVSVVN
jgi:hypothetical protein